MAHLAGLTPAPFEFATTARLVVGPGRAGELADLLAGLGSRALVCTGADPGRHEALLATLSLPWAPFPCPTEPSLALAREATAAAERFGADVVLGLGGGSVLDLGKAVAMLATNGGDPLDYLEVVGSGRAITRASLPYVAVPTTAGTGAEVTANAVLTAPEHGLKGSLRSPLMLPRLAVVDPLLARGCPPEVTAASGLDALTQCLEPFVSCRANPLTDALAREGLHRGARGLRAAYADGSDDAARYDLALCALFGGMALANAKLGAVHGIAGVLGGALGVPHGVACAALLVPVSAANVAALRARAPGSPVLDRYDEVGRVLTGRADATVEDGIAWLQGTLRRLAMPSLGEYGLAGADPARLVRAAAGASSMAGNPIVLTEQELRGILAAAT